MRVARHRLRCATIVLFVAALAECVAAAILEVDHHGGGYQTIQSALDAAVPGQDEVFVHCGTYREALNIPDGIALRGAGARCTTIDAAGIQNGYVVRAGQGTRLEGFTITGGEMGGVGAFAGEVVITRNVIRGNGDPGDIGNGGGGIYLANFAAGGPATTPEISHNLIYDNRATIGGGIVVTVISGAVITNNVIAGNHAMQGGAAFFYLAYDTTILNNTIVDNRAERGGGIDGLHEGTFANNALARNASTEYGAGDFYGSPSNVTFVSNDVWGNEPHQMFPNGPPGPGNFSLDPEILRTETASFASFEPRSTSPLIDRAAVDLAPSDDLRGISPPVDGDADGVRRRDIGARENEGITRVMHDGGGFVWDAGSHQPELYNVYRGDLAVLKQTGSYTQNPASVPGARHHCGIGASLADPDAPALQQVFFYLVTADGAVEGTLGYDSEAIERPRTLECTEP